MAKLTPKQEGFCLSYIETGNASEAYRLNYNAGNMAEATINSRASKLVKEYKISTRLEELQKHHQERHNVTVDSMTRELFLDRKHAKEVNQFSASISALNTIAKMHGLITNKQEVTSKDKEPVSVKLSGYDLARRVAYMLSQGNIDKGMKAETAEKESF